MKSMRSALVSAATLFAVFGAAGCSERFEENETGFRLAGDGTIREDITGPDWVCFVACDPFARSIKYKTFTDTFTISTNASPAAASNAEGQPETVQARPMLLRSLDRKFIDDISLAISWEVVPEASTENKRQLRSEFRAESSDVNTNIMSIRDDIQIEAIQPTVDVIGSVNALDIQSNGEQIGQRIATSLQAAINRRLGIEGDEVSPIRIRAVRIAGVAFDPETEATLRQLSLVEERGRIAAASEREAAGQISSAEVQAGVTAGIFDTLRGEVPQDQLATAACLDMVRQRLISEQQNCFPGMALRR